MPSPFPGMDPYIEHPEVWSDFHGALAEVMRHHQVGNIIADFDGLDIRLRFDLYGQTVSHARLLRSAGRSSKTRFLRLA